MTPKVPYVTDADHAQLNTRLGAPSHSVKSVEVEPPQDHMSAAILMTLKVVEHPASENPIHFALSPPAATQLSRALRRAVKDYLRGNSESGSRSEEDQS